LDSGEGKILKILLTDHASEETFERKIDAIFLQESPEMNAIFEFPEDIYDTLEA